MVTLGIDLASDPKRTALCWIRWHERRADVTRLETHGDDEAIITAISAADKVGIDIPLGWPVPFVSALMGHAEDGRWPPTAPQPMEKPKQLQYRQTDFFVHERTGRWPLSVSSDRIAIPAMRAAALFSRLPEGAGPISRDGSGRVTEVYPAAALRMWGFSADGYKRKENRTTRCELLHALVEETGGWMSLPPGLHASCEDSDDALDALIAALVARAQFVGRCEPIPPDALGLARKEGWIALPSRGSLAALAT